MTSEQQPEAHDVDVDADLDEVEGAEPSDDLPARAWVTIGLAVLIGIIFVVVCLPLIL